MMNDFEVIILNPPGSPDASLAIAGCRAGGIGVYNSELDRGSNEITAAIRAMSRFTNNPYGLKADTLSPSLWKILKEGKEQSPNVLVLNGNTPLSRASLSRMDKYRENGGRIFLEITAWGNQNHTGIEAHINGWWVKGNEAGGFVREESSFILFQRVINESSMPVYVRGGIGFYNSAAYLSGGASGVVLDSQLLLLRESPLRRGLTHILGDPKRINTILLGQESQGEYLRVLHTPGNSIIKKLSEKIEKNQGEKAYVKCLSDTLGWEDHSAQVLPLGQDCLFAKSFAERFGNVANTLKGMKELAVSQVKSAHDRPSLVAGSNFAKSIGSRYPIIQGAMSRVSDVPEFAAAVAKEGAMPCLALGLMDADSVRKLVKETRDVIGNLPMGVGLFGFAPGEVFSDQIKVLEEIKPSFAYIAGGRPDQAERLENMGIPTALHVPTPELLELFIDQGVRRFIFEGRECGGHIGPMSSMTMWQSMIDRLLDCHQTGKSISDIQVIFAGGIHDNRSAAMVATIAAPLADKGAGVGILMGTAYLFTREAVKTGAITSGFQKVAIECSDTATLTTGTGHASRCARTGFTHFFYETRKMLRNKETPDSEKRNELETLVRGRLRLATKGEMRCGHKCEIKKFNTREQLDKGMFMIGQLASLKKRSLSIKELHKDVTEGAMTFLYRTIPTIEKSDVSNRSKPVDIAIVGMGSLLPGSRDIQGAWSNLLNKVNVITEVPLHRWDWRLYYDEDRWARDKIYSKWGGFLDEIPFNPSEFGFPPLTLKSIEPLQLLTLEVVKQALKDAQMDITRMDRDHTSVILGISGGTGDLGGQYAARSDLPRVCGALQDPMLDRLPEWSEDSFAGILPNVSAGRVTNRFDFGGVNFTVDAACASSLAAVHQAVNELVSGKSDMVITGGADTLQSPFAYLCFSKTQALSPRGRSDTFDAEADGIVLSEGLVILLLKRLADAERDGDRIYAVIKGVGASSDGRGKSLTAPSSHGQIKAITRAYDQAGFSPSTLGLMEAHGTGTVAGDTVELDTIFNLMERASAPPGSCVVGSAKSTLGHTKASAGAVGLMKASMALYHKVLPPHGNIKRPLPRLCRDESPLFICRDPKPWVRPVGTPRRAGVSAFGFGGTNFHVALEEYTGEYRQWDKPSPLETWPCEIFAWRGKDRDALREKIQRTRDLVSGNHRIHLAKLSWLLFSDMGENGVSAAVVAGSPDEFISRVDQLISRIGGDNRSIPEGVYFSETELGKDVKTAFIFPGQGSQYTGMLRELAFIFPQVRSAFDSADRILGDVLDSESGSGLKLSNYVFPPDRYDHASLLRAEKALSRTEIAQPAIGTASVGIFYLLKALGITPDMSAGHSYGEFTALFSAGVLDFQEFILLSQARGRIMVQEAQGKDMGMMAAVMADMPDLEELLKEMPDLVAANHNSPTQVILSGPTEAVTEAIKILEKKEIAVTRLRVAAAFHSPIVEPARKVFSKYLTTIDFKVPKMPVYSNNTGRPHNSSPNDIRKKMTDHMVKPVRFVSEIEGMYEDGARIFVEVGPKTVLSGLVSQILGKKSHVAIGTDDSGGGISGLLHMLGTLLCHGVDINPLPIFEGRVKEVWQNMGKINKTDLLLENPLPEHAWLVSGGCARPVGGELCTGNSCMLTARECHDSIIKENDLTEKTSDHNLTMEEVKKSIMKDAGINLSSLPVSGSGTEKAILSYQETMRRFLEVQERVMINYLGSKDSFHMPTEIVEYEDPFDDDFRSVIPMPEQVITPEQPILQPEEKEIGSEPAAAEVSETSGATSQEIVPKNLDVQKIFLDIVSERTGYPVDMLGLEQDIEADLGIDSIKRVEILGAFQKILPEDARSVMRERMEEITGLKTLGQIIQWMNEMTLNQDGGDNGHQKSQIKDVREENRPFNRTGLESNGSCSPLPRFVIRGHEEPVDWVPEIEPEPGLYIITPDSSGISGELSSLLRDAGVEPVTIPEEFLTDESKIIKWVKEIKGRGEIKSVIHLASVGKGLMPDEIDLDQCHKQIIKEVKSFFFLLRETGHGFMKNGGQVLCVSDMGGFFGRNYEPGGKSQSAYPWGGGLSGLIKTITIEWNRDIDKLLFWGKAIDLDPTISSEKQAAFLFRELTLPGGRREVGYPEGRRTIFRTIPASVTPVKDNNRIPDKSWVVLATGGARGITAETLKGLLSFKSTLVLVGRTPLPEPENGLTRDLINDHDLREYFIKAMKESKKTVTPSQIQELIQSLKNNREITANIELFAHSGSKVDYRSCDMTDEKAVSKLFSDLYEEYGRIDAVIHGAGIIEDKLLLDKTAESIDRVINVKVDGALLLAKYLRPESLKFLAFFTSVAGRYGNRGQTDYSVANEIVNRIAWILHERFGKGVKIASINWGPWEATSFGPGMVSPEAKKQFEERGVSLVPPGLGTHFVFNELLYGDRDDVELVAGKGAWEFMESAANALRVPLSDKIIRDHSFPLLIGGTELKSENGVYEIEKKVDLLTDPYLDEHRLDGVPVLPFAGALEYTSEFISHMINGTGVVTGISNICSLKGLILENEKTEINISCAEPRQAEEHAEYAVQIRSGISKENLHYKATVITSRDILKSRKYELPTGLPPFPGDVSHVYERWLFHGPFFQTICKIEGCNEQEIVAELLPSSPSSIYPGSGEMQWIFDPALVDGILQLFVVWSRVFQASSCLPGMIGKISRFGKEALRAPLYLHLVMKSSPADIALEGDCALVDKEGNLRLLLENIEGTSSKGLNRLGGRWSGGIPAELKEIYV